MNYGYMRTMRVFTCEYGQVGGELVEDVLPANVRLAEAADVEEERNGGEDQRDDHQRRHRFDVA